MFVKDLKAGDVLVNHKFAIKEFVKKKGKMGNDYISVILSDKTGQVNAKVWQNNFANCDSEIKTGDVVDITGKVDSFNDQSQVIIEKAIKTKNFSPDDFLPRGERDPKVIWSYITDVIDSLKDEEIKSQIKKILFDPSIERKFKEVPAAELVHQDYVGGLMEHVYEMLKLAEGAKDLYPELKYSELVFGIIFHDIGKIEELETTGVMLKRTKAGYLLGHLAQGILLVNKYFDDSFDKNKRNRLMHMILSHNGKTELGSPVAPMTLEAILLSEIDTLSFLVGSYFSQIRKNEKDDNGLTGYNKYLGASVLHFED